MTSAFHTVSFAARRAVAWPVIVLGAVAVELGGGLIRCGAWLVDFVPEEGN